MKMFFWSIKTKVISLYKVLRTMLLALFRRSDYQRWRREESFKKSWDQRTKLIASLIPEGSSVLEFGAGKMSLKSYLPLGCRYTPADMVERGNGTIVCDLNDICLPLFEYSDIVVFGGVLEYIYDLDRLMSHLKNSCRIMIASYAVSDFQVQKKTFQRRKHGWVNEYSKAEFLDLFSRHGLTCVQILPWENQYIFKFVRENGGTISAN